MQLPPEDLRRYRHHRKESAFLVFTESAYGHYIACVSSSIVLSYLLSIILLLTLTSPSCTSALFSLAPFSPSLPLPIVKAAAAVQPLCPAVNAATSFTSLNINNNAVFFGNECRYANFTLSLGTTVGNTNEVSVDIIGGTVSEGSQNGILFKGLTVSTFANLGDRGPLRIAVRNVKFFAGTVLKFDRLFPDGTDIVVAGNTFINMQGLINLGGAWLTCILVDFSAGGITTISYSRGFSLVIENNTATVNTTKTSKTNAYVCVACIIHESITESRSLTIGGTSRLVMRGNALVNSIVPTIAHVVYVRVSAYAATSSSVATLAVDGSGIIVASGNTIVNSATGYTYVMYLYTYCHLLSSSFFSVPPSSTIAMKGSGTIVASGNTIVNSATTYAYGVYIYAYGFSVAAAIADISVSLAIEGNAAMTASGNTITNSTTAYNAYAVYLYVSAAARSSETVPFSFLAVKDNGSMVVSGNVIANSTVAADAYGVYVNVRLADDISTVGDPVVSSVYTSLKGKASMSITDNAIANSSVMSNAYAVCVWVESQSPDSSSLITIEGNASMTVSRNAIANINHVTNAYTLLVCIRSSSTPSPVLAINGGGAALRVQNNTIRVKPSVKSALLIVFGIDLNDRGATEDTCRFEVLSQSRVHITGNSIGAVGDGAGTVSATTCTTPSHIGAPASALASLASTIAVFEAIGAFQLTLSGGGLINISNNAIGNVAGNNIRIARLELDTDTTRPSRVVGPNPAGFVVNGNTICRTTVQCAGVVSSSSLSFWFVTSEMSFDGGRTGLSASNNVINGVSFAPNATAPSSPSCVVAFAMMRFSSNVNIINGASVALVGNQVTGVYGLDASSRQKLSTDAKASGGCLLTVNGTVSIGGAQSGSEILIATNSVTDVNTSRSLVAFTSSVGIARGAGMVVRGNRVTYTSPTLTSTGPWGLGPRSLLWVSGELSWASGWSGLNITNNVIASASLGFPIPSQWVLLDNSGTVKIVDALGLALIVLCPNKLFGVNQERTVIEMANLVTKPNTLKTTNSTPKIECLRAVWSETLSVNKAPSRVRTSASTLALSTTASLPLTFSHANTSTRASTIATAPMITATVQRKPAAMTLTANTQPLDSLSLSPFLVRTTSTLRVEMVLTLTVTSEVPDVAVSRSLSPSRVPQRTSHRTRSSPKTVALTLIFSKTWARSSATTRAAPLSLSLQGSATPAIPSTPITIRYTATREEKKLVEVTESATVRRIVPFPFIPSPTLEKLTTVVGVAVVAIGGIALPVAGMTQGVSMALLRMSQCGEEALSEDEALPVMVHPLQFGIGDGEAKYARGAIVGNLILVPLACVLLFYFAIPLLVSAARHGTDFKSEMASFRPRTGWPANMIVPFSLLAESTAMTATSLLLASEASALDTFLGTFGAIAMLTTTVIWALKLRYPFGRGRGGGRQLQCVRAEPQGTLLMWLLNSRWEWALAFDNGEGGDGGTRDAVNDDTATALLPSPHNGSPDEKENEEKYFVRRWSFLVGDSWWLWSSFLAFAFSLLVGVAEGMPSNTQTLCRLRWSLASIGAVGQAFVVLTASVPSELALVGLSSVVSCALVVLVALSTFNVMEDEKEALNEALELVGTISAVLGLVTMGIGIVCSLSHLYTQWAASRGKRARKEGRRGTGTGALLFGDPSFNLELDIISERGSVVDDPLPSPPLSTMPTMNHADSQIAEPPPPPFDASALQETTQNVSDGQFLDELDVYITRREEAQRIHAREGGKKGGGSLVWEPLK